MRADSFGLFWEERPVERARDGQAPAARTPPPIPETGWTTPRDFPRLDSAAAIAFDTETYDPNLLTHGPGWGRGDGHLVGLSVGVMDPNGRTHAWYFPMRHEVGGGNLDPAMVLKWAQRELGRERQPKVGANLEYDLGWLAEEGVTVRGPLIDVQYAEPLLDEHRLSYSLDSLAEHHLGAHKVDEALYDWLHRAYGGPKGRKQAANIYRAPVALAGPYAEGDVDLPLRIWAKQERLLEEQGLLELFRLECDLIPILVAMRLKGTRVDVAKAEQARELLLVEEAAVAKQLRRLCGFEVNVDVSADLQRAFNAAGLSYPTTAKGNPSFTAAFLDTCPGDLGNLIRAKRRAAKTRGTFIEGYILNKQVNGVLRGSFHPLRSDDGGTVSGRFSSSNPNWQNLPSRDKATKQLVRGLCLPWEGEEWHSLDYSQIEYRFLAHYALGPGAEELRQVFRNDPKADFHEQTRQLILQVTGKELERKPTKNINFGLCYGMSEAKLKRDLQLTDTEGDELFHAYHTGAPFVKHTYNTAMQRAAKRGYIRTIGGRYARFNRWEPRRWDDRDSDLPLAEAEAKWGRGNLQRSRTHKALNALLQGSSADLIKRAMVDIYQQLGLVPLNTVHDELNFSLPEGSEGHEAAREVKRLMEQAVQLNVPVVCDAEYGPNWADLKALEE